MAFRRNIRYLGNRFIVTFIADCYQPTWCTLINLKFNWKQNPIYGVPMCMHMNMGLIMGLNMETGTM